MPSLTMAMLAEKLNVAQSTVSRALANHPSISQAQRRRIQAAARRYGYRPNPMVSALMAGRRQRTDGTPPVIGLIHHGRRDNRGQLISWASYYVDAIHDRATHLGYQIDQIDPIHEKLDAKRVAVILRTRNVKGVIIGPGLPQWIGNGKDFNSFALATYGSSELQAKMHTAVLDYYQGMTLALQNIAAAGGRRVLFSYDRTLDERLGHRWLAAARIAPEIAPELEVIERPFEWQAFDAGSFIEDIRRLKADTLLTHARLIPRALANHKKWKSRAPWLVGLNPLADAPQAACVVDDRGAVGAAAVDLVVAQLHRHERGMPETPKLVVIENRWSAGTSKTKKSGIRAVDKGRIQANN